MRDTLLLLHIDVQVTDHDDATVARIWSSRG
jgi:hypothetical protein